MSTEKAAVPGSNNGEGMSPVQQCLHAVLDNLNPSVLTALLTVEGKVAYVSPTALEIIDKDLEEILCKPFPGTPWWEFSADARANLTNAIKAGAAGDVSHFEHVLPDQEGKLRTMDLWLHPLYRVDGQVIGLVVSAQDITQRRAAETALLHTQFAVDHAYGAIFELSVDGHILYVNKAAYGLVGYPQDALLDLSFGNIDAGLISEDWQARWNKLKSNGAMHFESWFRHHDGHLIAVDVSAVYLEHEGEQYGFVYAQDISERKAAQERIHYATYYDALTGLPNRILLNDRLNQAVQFAAHRRTRLAVMYIGLDRFKLINDSLGTVTGDEVLRVAARRIADCVQPGDTVSRTGSDEFVVLLASGRGDGNDPDQTAKCILGAFVTPVEVHGQQLFVTCSIGLAVYREGGTESDELLENAYAALQKAKAHGGNSMSAYSHSSSTRDIERLPLEAALRRAPERSELLVFYQPQVDVRTGEIVGAEALLRWHPPHKREVSPARFIPIAEETGLIIPIGEWVLRAACCRIKAWRRPGSPLKRIAVNLSARQFRDTDLAKFLAGLLKEFDIDPACLELELTESMLIEDIESAIQTMKELKVLGVHMALDDFGTGHSSLSYLRRFPIETLKIDQSFIREIAVDKTSVAVSEGIVTLARLLGLNVVAEGVETESQLTILQSIGCNVCQGHLFSKPLSAEKFNALLAERPSQDSNANKYVG